VNPTWTSDCGTVRLWLGDCLDVMATWPDGAVDAVVTDPPYGCGKASWDAEWKVGWYQHCKRAAETVAVITGSAGIRDAIDTVGGDFVDCIAARNMNGMTRGPIGFGNWLSCVIAGKKPPMGWNCFDFVVSGIQPPHPSPKPLEYMKRLIERLDFQTIADPFMGSGTTGVAAVRLGRSFWGVELDPTYFEIAKKRIQDELRRVAFLEGNAEPKQQQRELAI